MVADAARAVWRFHDGKRGHENQTLGLLEHLAERVAITVHDVAVPPGRPDPALPPPWLLVGAGRATHLPMLAARRTHGGRVVVLMRPLLPRRCFDLVIVPEHDGVAPDRRTLVTRGALNRMRPATTREPDLALVLVGGPSRHHGFDARALAEAVAMLVERAPTMRWVIATSRRTPPELTATLRRIAPDLPPALGPDEVDASWLPATLGRAAWCWVTEDSVSMVYEALTAGAATGILPVPRRGRAGRVVRGVQRLVAEGTVVPLARWLEGEALRPPRTPLAEARRCADWIADHWSAGASPGMRPGP